MGSLGREIEHVLKDNGPVSALACYITAMRAGRSDLAD